MRFAGSRARRPAPEVWLRRRASRLSIGALQTGRASWIVVDQCTSSASNFIFVAAVARGSSAKTFGAFSLAYLLYAITLGGGRAIGGDVLLLRAEEDPANVRSDCGRLLGLAVMLGSIVGAVLVLVSVAATGAFAKSLFALALALPVVLAQDALRYCFFALKFPARAATNDLIWLAVQLVAFGGLFLWHPSPGPVAIIAAWASGAAVAVTIGSLQAGLAPRFRQVSKWLTEDRSRVISFLADFLLMTGSIYAALYLVAIVGSITDVAAVRGVLLLFAPLDALMAGVHIFTLPVLARSLARGVGPMLTRAGLISAATSALTAVWAIALLAMPHEWGKIVLGSTWDLSRPLILVVSVASIARFAGLSAVDGLRALGGGRTLVSLRAIATTLVFSAVVVGTSVQGAQGAVDGLAAALSIGAVMWWRGVFVVGRARAATREGG